MNIQIHYIHNHFRLKLKVCISAGYQTIDQNSYLKALAENDLVTLKDEYWHILGYEA